MMQGTDYQECIVYDYVNNKIEKNFMIPKKHGEFYSVACAYTKNVYHYMFLGTV